MTLERLFKICFQFLGRILSPPPPPPHPNYLKVGRYADAVIRIPLQIIPLIARLYRLRFDDCQICTPGTLSPCIGGGRGGGARKSEWDIARRCDEAPRWDVARGLDVYREWDVVTGWDVASGRDEVRERDVARGLDVSREWYEARWWDLACGWDVASERDVS
jgi:hypothetical protein